MIGGIFRNLRSRLAAKGVPYELTYGPPQVPVKVGATRVCMWRDTDAGDQLGPSRSQHQNPRQYAVRSLGVAFWIFAQSTVPGAERFDHEAIADGLADQILVEFHKLARASKTLHRVTRAGFLGRSDVTDGWAGVVYELRLTIDHGVRDVSWLGDAAPENADWSATTTLDANGVGTAGTVPTATTRSD